MRKFLFWTALAALISVVVCGVVIYHLVQENARLRSNEHALLQGVEFYRTESGRSAASVEALQLKLADFREQRSRDVEEIASLGIRLRRAESYAKSVAVTRFADTIVVRDTVVIRDTVAVAARHFEASDAWSRVVGILFGDSLQYAVRTVDTLHQVIHRVPRKFLFIPYGTKAIRQEVWTSNPNTELVYTEYIELPRRRKQR
jgi:hypothetical protein